MAIQNDEMTYLREEHEGVRMRVKRAEVIRSKVAEGDKYIKVNTM